MKIQNTAEGPEQIKECAYASRYADDGLYARRFPCIRHAHEADVSLTARCFIIMIMCAAIMQ